MKVKVGAHRGLTMKGAETEVVCGGFSTQDRIQVQELALSNAKFRITIDSNYRLTMVLHVDGK